ncbi:MAG: putative inorganic carbon transporter subunit DabA, partial [Bdellovibrionota bacterium]
MFEDKSKLKNFSPSTDLAEVNHENFSVNSEVADSFSPEQSIRKNIASRENWVLRAIEHSAHLLPAQGPIGVFIHHNTLHAFQDWNFEDAVDLGAEIFRAEPYWSESTYRDAYAKGRITKADIDAVLELESRLLLLRSQLKNLSAKEVYTAALLHGAAEMDEITIQWQVEENAKLKSLPRWVPAAVRNEMGKQSARIIGDLLNRKNYEKIAEYLTGQKDFRLADQILGRRVGLAFNPRSLEEACMERREALSTCALWVTCEAVVKKSKTSSKKKIKPNSQFAISEDVNYFVSRFCSVYLDQGVAGVSLPDREQGFYSAFCNMLLKGPVPAFWLKPARAIVENYPDPMSAALWALRQLKISDQNLDSFIESELLALSGWAGLIHRLAVEPTLAPRRKVQASLLEYLAVRLICNVFVQDRKLITESVSWNERSRTWDLFGVASALGISPTLESSDLFSSLLLELDQFIPSERRQVWHLAYEHHHEQEVLGAIQSVAPHVDHSSPRLQIVTCIDEREESLRRHIEEQGEEIETLGAAGFFGVAMNYRGIDDVSAAPYCPVVVKPEHTVTEKARTGSEEMDGVRRTRRKLWGTVNLFGSKASRGLVLSPVFILIGGVAVIALSIARVLAPGRLVRIQNWFSQTCNPKPPTLLTLLKNESICPICEVGTLR